MTLTVGSLFSGIGGLELGLERAVEPVEREPEGEEVHDDDDGEVD